MNAENNAPGRSGCAGGHRRLRLGILAAARALGLDFVPLLNEQYDLVIPSKYPTRGHVSRPYWPSSALRSSPPRWKPSAGTIRLVLGRFLRSFPVEGCKWQVVSGRLQSKRIIRPILQQYLSHGFIRSPKLTQI